MQFKKPVMSIPQSKVFGDLQNYRRKKRPILRSILVFSRLVWSGIPGMESFPSAPFASGLWLSGKFSWAKTPDSWEPLSDAVWSSSADTTELPPDKPSDAWLVTLEPVDRLLETVDRLWTFSNSINPTIGILPIVVSLLRSWSVEPSEKSSGCCGVNSRLVSRPLVPVLEALIDWCDWYSSAKTCPCKLPDDERFTAWRWGRGLFAVVLVRVFNFSWDWTLVAVFNFPTVGLFVAKVVLGMDVLDVRKLFCLPELGTSWNYQ